MHVGRALVIAFAFVPLGLGAAQDGLRAQTDQSIVGRVIDATTEAPIEGAVVSVTRSVTPLLRGLREPGPADKGVMTAADGTSVLTDPPPHFVFLVASDPAYASGMYGQRFPGDSALDWADSKDAPVIRLERLATIAGAVHDDRNEPVAGQTVRALHKTLVGGQWRFVST